MRPILKKQGIWILEAQWRDYLMEHQMQRNGFAPICFFFMEDCKKKEMKWEKINLLYKGQHKNYPKDNQT